VGGRVMVISSRGLRIVMRRMQLVWVMTLARQEEG